MIPHSRNASRPAPKPVSRWVEDETLERLIFASDLAVIGSLNSPPNSSYFAGEHQTTNYLFGFPRSSLWIRQNRGKPFVADPTVATVYNRGQVFVREKISPEGDVGEWFGVSEDVVRDAVRTFDPKVADSASPLAFVSARVCSDMYRRQRAAALRASSGQAPASEIEEAVVLLIWDVISGAYCKGDWAGSRVQHRQGLVERAREVIDATLTENLGVREIAARCGSSVFHLCRVFRAATGKTLFAYRRDLRLRAALDLIPERRGDLSRVALELGFFSHSHFTAAFRREFGMSPTAFAATRPRRLATAS
jgi:AraC family transcriptional regulator